MLGLKLIHNDTKGGINYLYLHITRYIASKMKFYNEAEQYGMVCVEYNPLHEYLFHYYIWYIWKSFVMLLLMGPFLHLLHLW